MVRTVRGEKRRDELGIVTPHEHIFIDLSAFFTAHPVEDIDDVAAEPVKMRHLGVLNRDPYALKDNLIMDDYETQLKEILRFKKAGGGTILDATMPGIGRDAHALKKMSEESGIHIVMGTGYYVYSTHPKELEKLSEEAIADGMVREITEGIDGICAGVIGKIGISEIFTPSEKKVVRAAAIAHRKTGTPILLHINPWTEYGVEACEILLGSGVAPNRITVSHVDVLNRVDYIHKLLKMGVYIEFDNFGKQYFVDQDVRSESYGPFVTDVERVLLLKQLVEEGFEKQILLSCDVCLKMLLCEYGGWGYAHVLKNVVPMMREFGIPESAILQMTEQNPLDFLDGEEIV